MNAEDTMSIHIDTAQKNSNIEQTSAKLFAGEFNGVLVV
jgi:hypothetical protein